MGSLQVMRCLLFEKNCKFQFIEMFRKTISVIAKIFDNFGHSTDINAVVSRHVETCVLLVRELADDDEVVSIKVDMDGISLDQGKYIPPEKPTYKNIKQWILDKYGFKVSTLYIAQIKNKVGLEKRKNYNPGSGDGKVPICPPEKEEAIMDAFRHFGLI